MDVVSFSIFWGGAGSWGCPIPHFYVTLYSCHSSMVYQVPKRGEAQSLGVFTACRGKKGVKKGSTGVSRCLSACLREMGQLFSHGLTGYWFLGGGFWFV